MRLHSPFFTLSFQTALRILNTKVSKIYIVQLTKPKKSSDLIENRHRKIQLKIVYQSYQFINLKIILLTRKTE